MSCQAIRQHLLALQYDDSGNSGGSSTSPDDTICSSSMSDPEWIRRVIVWLEDTKIRQYAVEDRKRLKSTEEGVWHDAVRDYIRHLQCPTQVVKGENVQHVISEGDVSNALITTNELLWVLGYAVGLAYDDGVESGRGFDDVMARDIIESSIRLEGYDDTKDKAPLADIHDVQAINAFERVCNVLSVRREHHNAAISIDDVSKCLYRVKHEIAPVLEKKEKCIFSLDDDQAIQKIIPLGFTTGDSDLDLVARVLRILHIKELRRLQNAIDEAIVKHQDLTANPRTETGRHKKKNNERKMSP